MSAIAGSHSPSITVLSWSAGLCVCLAAAAPPAASAALPVATPTLAVTLLAKGQTAQTALHRLARDIGLHYTGSADPARTLGTDLVGVPLDAALRELLEGRSYYVQWGNAHRPTRVVVLSGPAAEPAALATRVPAQPRDAALSTNAARAAGAPSSSLSAPEPAARAAAVNEAASSDDPAARIEAVERLGERSDAKSQALVLRALGDANDAVRAVAREAYDRQQARRATAPTRR